MVLAVEGGQNVWMAEFRFITTLFIRLSGLKCVPRSERPCPLSRLQHEARTPPGGMRRYESTDDLDLVQKAITAVQDSLYAYEGTWCRFIVDDKVRCGRPSRRGAQPAELSRSGAGVRNPRSVWPAALLAVPGGDVSFILRRVTRVTVPPQQ